LWVLLDSRRLRTPLKLIWLGLAVCFAGFLLETVSRCMRSTGFSVFFTARRDPLAP